MPIHKYHPLSKTAEIMRVHGQVKVCIATEGLVKKE